MPIDLSWPGRTPICSTASKTWFMPCRYPSEGAPCRVYRSGSAVPGERSLDQPGGDIPASQSE